MNYGNDKQPSASLNNAPLNLSEDHINSIAELRRNALLLEFRLGSP